MRRFIFLSLLTALWLCLPTGVAAQQPRFGNFEAKLPGIENNSIDAFIDNPTPILTYASFIINFVTGGIIVIGLISMVAGAFFYMTAGGDKAGVEKGKKFIIASLSGIVLALTAWVILNTISTQFTSGLKEPTIRVSCRVANPKCPAGQACVPIADGSKDGFCAKP